jgi:hypothetical protein
MPSNVDNRLEDLKKRVIPFTILATGLSALLFFYFYLTQQPVAEVHGWRKDVAEGFGTVGLYLLAIIYGRTLLKILLNEGPLLERFLPQEYLECSLPVGKKVLVLLNQTHKYVGAAAIVALATHGLLMGWIHRNLFLQLVLVLLVWQGLFGLFLVVRFPIKTLKRYSYLAHAQLFTGVLLSIFASFGHLLTKGL